MPACNWPSLYWAFYNRETLADLAIRHWGYRICNGPANGPFEEVRAPLQTIFEPIKILPYILIVYIILRLFVDNITLLH